MATPPTPEGGIPSPAQPSNKPIRAVLGASIGALLGGLIGWLIDSAITSDPYAGVRIGSFVGALCGSVVGQGAGWRGIGAILLMVLCSLGGAVLGLVIWYPGPDDLLSLLPAMIGGVAGAFAGMFLAVIFLRLPPSNGSAHKPAAPAI